MTTKEMTKELARLRNRHVAKILTFFGPDTPEYIVAGIKRSYSFFEEDVQVNIIDKINE